MLLPLQQAAEAVVDPPEADMLLRFRHHSKTITQPLLRVKKKKRALALRLTQSLQ